MKAARAGDLPAVTALLDADAELVNARDADRKTALHHAATAGNLDVVKLLVERGADVSVRDRWNITPMGRAALHQHTPVAEYLAGAPGADKGEKGVAGMFLDHNIAIDKSNDAADGVDTSRPRK
jgi:ankyrin repeat protein